MVLTVGDQRGEVKVPVWISYGKKMRVHAQIFGSALKVVYCVLLVGVIVE